MKSFAFLFYILLSSVSNAQSTYVLALGCPGEPDADSTPGCFPNGGYYLFVFTLLLKFLLFFLHSGVCDEGVLQSYSAETGVYTIAYCTNPTDPLMTYTGCYPNQCCTAPGYTLAQGSVLSFVDSCPPGAELSRMPISDLSASQFPYAEVGIFIGGIATGATAFYAFNKFRNTQPYEEVKELVPKKYATSTELL